MTEDTRSERELAAARDEGTDIIDRENDLPPPAHYRAASDLHRLFTEKQENFLELAEEIVLPGDDPALWERLDVARAASYAQEKYPDDFAAVAEAHPWLQESADSSAHDALGSMGDRFLGQ